MNTNRRRLVGALVGAALLLGGTSAATEARSGVADDDWLCAAADDPTYGEGHYDNMLEGWLVTAPDGKHEQWGAKDCFPYDGDGAHTPADPA